MKPVAISPGSNYVHTALSSGEETHSTFKWNTARMRSTQPAHRAM